MAGKNKPRITRRRFLVTSALTSGGLLTANWLSKSGLAQSTAPGIVTSEKMRPQIPYGVASGDVSSDQAVIWSKSYPPNTGQLLTTQPFQRWIASLSKRYVIRVMEPIGACQLIVEKPSRFKQVI